MKKLLFLSAVLIFGLASCGSENYQEEDTPYTPDYISASLDGVVINGIRWATRNVDMPGTFANMPQGFGMLYQWNRRTAWEVYLVEHHPQREGWDNSMSECEKWYAENDPCPEGWRVPTLEELKSLIAANHIWATYQGVNGAVFGTAPNRIFLPATGWSDRNLGSHAGVGKIGKYWGSTPCWLWEVGAETLVVIYDDVTYNHWSWRNNANSVRCVAID